MTVLSDDRTALDDALDDPTNTLLILFDSEDDTARRVHDEAHERAGFPERRTFLIEDRELLTAEELELWPAGDDEFVIWSCFVNVGFFDSLDALMLANGVDPSILRIRQAFMEGEEL